MQKLWAAATEGVERQHAVCVGCIHVAAYTNLTKITVVLSNRSIQSSEYHRLTGWCAQNNNPLTAERYSKRLLIHFVSG